MLGSLVRRIGPFAVAVLVTVGIAVQSSAITEAVVHPDPPWTDTASEPSVSASPPPDHNNWGSHPGTERRPRTGGG